MNSRRWALAVIAGGLLGLSVTIVGSTVGTTTSTTAASTATPSAGTPTESVPSLRPHRSDGEESSPTPTPRPPKRLVVDHGFDDIGVLVYDHARPGIALEHNAHEQFTSASLVKLLIAFDALEQGAPPSDVHTMIAESHDPLAGQFWVWGGRPDLVTRWAERLGLENTEAPELPNMWGDTLTTAADMVKVYRYLLHEAPPKTRDVVLSALRASTPHGHDGFYQHFGIPDAAGELPFAVKQGWACCTDERVLHTSGLVGHDDRYIVVVLTRTSRDVGYETVSANLTSYVRQVLEATGMDLHSPLPERPPVRGSGPG